MGSGPVAEFLGTAAEGAGIGGEAVYCAVILWLSVVSWIIFTWVGSDDDGGGGSGSGRRRRRRGSRGAKVFVGATRLCDSTGPRCSGGYGLCGTCVD